MTTADFIAGCFWPLAIAFTFLLIKVKQVGLRLWLGRCAFGIGFLYLVLWFLFSLESLVGIVDQFIFMGVLGAGLCWAAAKNKLLSSDPKLRTKRYISVAFGAGCLLISGKILFDDFVRPRVVLEGRVENVRTLSGRMRERGADIVGRTVKATAPVYERLKLKPYVRVEVGRGSGYIYKIEYLAN